MQEGQDIQVAQVLSGMESKEEETREKATKEQKPSPLEEEKENCLKEKAQLVKATLTPHDADFLVGALLKLKQAKLNKHQASRIAGFVRHLKPLDSSEDGKASDEALLKLSKHLKKNDKSDEILDVLRGLRRICLNDPERAELAEVVRGLGKGYKYRNEIADTISKLRKVRMTPSEAKEAAGIMFNLRKVKRRSLDLENSREVINLRKVMPIEKANLVVAAFEELSKVHLTENEVDEVTGAVADLGVEPIGSNEHQSIYVHYHDGKPELVISIPSGEEYITKMEELAIGTHVKNKTRDETGETRFSIILDDEEELPKTEACTHVKTKTDETGGTRLSIILDSKEELPNTEECTEVKNKTTDETGGTRLSIILDNEEELPKTEEWHSDEASLDEKELEKKDRMIIKIKSKNAKSSALSPRPSPLVSPKRSIAKKLHHYGDLQASEKSPIDETKEMKIKFSNKPHWRHKKHNCTVVNEKRWRFEESFNVDEVIWSPLSREQYDRRKTVGASILASMKSSAPLDDMVLDEFEQDGEHCRKST